MLGTLFSVLIAAYFILNPLANDLKASTTFIDGMMVVTAILFLVLFAIGMMLAWLPLQKAEQNSTPRIMEMYRKDLHVRFASVWLILFPIISFALVFSSRYEQMINKSWFFAIWLVLLGISIDCLRSFVRRISGYLNPLAVVKMFAQEGRTCIQNERELDLCQWIDALSEVASKGLMKHSTAVTNVALSEEQDLARLFFESSKSISHHSQDKQTSSVGITDKVSYTMFYLYQRLDYVFENALKNKHEPTCSQIITIFGKIAIDAAKYDVSMATAPLRFLGKLAKRAQDEGLEETAIKASCVLYEVAKAILTEIDISYYEIKDAYLSIINSMEVLAQGAFKKDKSINLNLLSQPFKDLKELFQSNAKAREHQDTPVIMQNIDRVIGEFDALQTIMTTLPIIPVEE